MTVGVGVFVLPSAFIAGFGTFWAPILVLAVGVGLIPIALCFAELGGRYDESGGPYLYVRCAFGPMAGFLVGWLSWVTRIVSHASVLVVGIDALQGVTGDFLDPTLLGIALATGITGVLCFINVRGSSPGISLLFGLSIFKFAPLFLLIVFGLPFVLESGHETTIPTGMSDWGQTMILAAFGLVGFEMLTVVGGETRDPNHSMPRALILALVFATVFMSALTFLTANILDNPSISEQPLVDVAESVLGPLGTIFVISALIFSVLGHNASSLIASSRILFSLGEKRDIPSFFATIHKRFKTPGTSLVVCAAVIVALAVSGSYIFLAVLGGVTRILIYFAIAATTIRLRTERFSGAAGLTGFKAPGGMLMPAVSLVFCIFLLTGTTIQSILSVMIALAIGVAFYFIAKRA